jgi:hypothetical protein
MASIAMLGYVQQPEGSMPQEIPIINKKAENAWAAEQRGPPWWGKVTAWDVYHQLVQDFAGPSTVVSG